MIDLNSHHQKESTTIARKPNTKIANKPMNKSSTLDGIYLF
jgi:hypothetical protein